MSESRAPPPYSAVLACGASWQPGRQTPSLAGATLALVARMCAVHSHSACSMTVLHVHPGTNLGPMAALALAPELGKLTRLQTLNLGGACTTTHGVVVCCLHGRTVFTSLSFLIVRMCTANVRHAGAWCLPLPTHPSWSITVCICVVGWCDSGRDPKQTASLTRRELRPWHLRWARGRSCKRWTSAVTQPVSRSLPPPCMWYF